MILYLDTSAFLKLYLEETGSSHVRQLVGDAVAVCTHLITYAEMRAGFAQAARIQRITDNERDYQKTRFEGDWQALQVLALDEPMVRRAGELAEGFALRGYDSLQLAAAERIWRQIGTEFHFAVFDKQLLNAAALLGMAT
jgi:predicted nucleic acid-binding protein